MENVSRTPHLNLEQKVALPANFRKRWLEALRSGEYPQVSEHLYLTADPDWEIGEGYCCLGVACVIQGVPIEEINRLQMPNEVNEGYRELIPNALLKRSYQFHTVKDIAEQRNNSTNIDPEYSEFLSVVTSMNDNLVSFDMIANWIEENTFDEKNSSEQKKRNYGERDFYSMAREDSFVEHWADIIGNMRTATNYEEKETFIESFRLLKTSIDSYELLSKSTQDSKEESQTTG